MINSKYFFDASDISFPIINSDKIIVYNLRCPDSSLLGLSEIYLSSKTGIRRAKEGKCRRSGPLDNIRNVEGCA